MKYPGYFVTFEGTEKAGKSTQVALLKRWLQAHRIPVVDTFEPGGSRLGTNMRRWLLKPGHGLTVESELLLFLADRAQHVAEVIRPSLRKGLVVVCDRYTDSTLAYQGGGRGYPLHFLKRLNALATGGLKPNLTFLLDLPIQVGMKRLKKGTLGDRMERERLAFHQRVRSTFRHLARKEKNRFIMLDGKLSPEEISGRVRKFLARRLPLHLKRRILRRS